MEIELSKKDLDDLHIFASLCGHIGDGNFHTFIMYDRKDPEERERVETVVHTMVKRALEMEGSCTVSTAHPRVSILVDHSQGEHGIGLGKKEFLLSELGPDTINVMRNVKLALDPHWLMNPGKIFDYSRSSKPTNTSEVDTARLVRETKKST
jgi:D-lactate dehydrogenase (cytochrome)